MSSHSTIAVSSVASSSRHSTASALSTSGSQYFGKETSHRSIHSTTQTPVQSLSKASLGSETSTAELSTFTTSTTVYKEWTGTFTSTYSTQVSTMVERTSEGPDGKVTIEIIYYVETPLTREASSTATTNPSSASLPRISNIATISNERTTMVTVTSCNSHFCTETVSPAIISTVTTNVKNIVTEYTTWCPISATAALEQTTEETMTSSVFDAYSKSVSAAVASTAALTNGNDAITKGTIGHPIATETTVVPSSRASDSEDAVVSGSTKTAIPNSSTSIIAEVSTRSAIALGSDVSSTSTVIKVTSGAAIIPEPATSQTNFQTHITTYFTTNSQQPQVSSSRSSSNTVSLQLSSYAGIANNLISHSAWSVFIASILLAIV
ncbi:uncharacterized protein DI49_1716 [Saccharomyces eubayanus]|uniref:uncharacterized protein n=1 Tax=Saccharomyces eubayanus TaxID=1080349 RepID=UPI0006C520AB|nr:hypothetical protein DI49_1716 [Saccharomyces eubayanus]KOG99873.1 hypothetical protein DI49_1716 [Saccharomyces eubayanus]